MRSLTSLLLASTATALFASLATAAPQCPADDAFEDNDSCASPVSVSTGTTTGLSALNGDDDYWSISVPAGHVLQLDALFTHVAGTSDLDLQLYDTGCFIPIASSTSIDDNESITWSNSSGSAETVIARVYGFGGLFVCADYNLSVATQADPCLASVPDPYEPNENCATSFALTLPGAHTGLNVLSGDYDYYLLTVPIDQVLTVDVTFIHASDGNLDAVITNATCNINEATGLTQTDNEQLVVLNDTGLQQDYVLRVFGSGAGFVCNTYDLNLSIAPDPCSLIPNDSFSPNEDCTTAAPIGAGSYPSLAVYLNLEDWFVVTVPDQTDLTIDLSFLHASADIDFYAYDSCGGTLLTAGTSATDDELATFSNTSGSAVNVYLLVEVWDGSDGRCSVYDMALSITGPGSFPQICAGDGSAGAACPCGNVSMVGDNEGCMNSQGHGAKIAASGTAQVAADDLSFLISQARPGQPSMLVQGAVLTAFPFKDGVLCMGNPTERVEVVFLDTNGEGATATSMVTGGVVSPGDTRYYQFWYRDPQLTVCGSGSNFSSGLEVSWI